MCESDWRLWAAPRRMGPGIAPTPAQLPSRFPKNLEVSLAKNGPAAEAFAALDGASRYAVLYRLATARRLDIRARRIQQLVDMLTEGKSIHPTRKDREPGGVE